MGEWWSVVAAGQCSPWASPQVAVNSMVVANPMGVLTPIEFVGLCFVVYQDWV